MPEYVSGVYTASLSNSILANYQSDFWKATAEYWFSFITCIANAFMYLNLVSCTSNQCGTPLSVALKHDLEYFHSIVIINYEKCLRMKLADENAVY